jgi:hypothetical protein
VLLFFCSNGALFCFRETLAQCYLTNFSVHSITLCFILLLGSDLLPVFNHIDMISYRDEESSKLHEYKDTMFDDDLTAQSATLAASCDKNSAVEHVTEYSGAAAWAKRAAEWAKRVYITQDEELQALLDAQRTMRAFSRDEPR